VSESIARKALADPFYRRRPPKTCGREEFGLPTVDKLFFSRGRARGTTADLLATAVEISARGIATAIQSRIARFTPTRRLIVSGGGVKNRVLMERLHTLLRGWEIATPEEWGIPVTHLEPVGFAILAHETLRARAGNLGGATGGRPAVLGLIAQPGIA
jgi:anhydro-N-acetylmuramic acid kinase